MTGTKILIKINAIFKVYEVLSISINCDFVYVLETTLIFFKLMFVAYRIRKIFTGKTLSFELSVIFVDLDCTI